MSRFVAIIKNPKLYKPAYTKYANSYTNGQLFTMNCDNCATTNLEVSIGSPDEPKTDLCLDCYSILAQALEPTTYEPFCDSNLIIDISPRNIVKHRFYLLEYLHRNYQDAPYLTP